MIGIDVVDIDRLRGALSRSPGLETRLFSDRERRYCAGRNDAAVHLAGTLAAKEAVIKAAGLGSLVGWARRIEIERDRGGAPHALVAELGLEVAVSISHDGGWAAAVALKP